MSDMAVPPTDPPADLSIPLDEIPGYTPYAPGYDARPATPIYEPESDDESPLSSARQPKGQQLVVRGCISHIPSETPTTLVKNLINSLGNEPRYRYFRKIPFVVTPFNDRPSNVSSACYIELGKLDDDGSSGSEPRVDLLYRISSAIAEAKPEWEVRWSASRKGRSDKRLSCRLLGLYAGTVSRDSIPQDHLPVIRSHIEGLGFRVAAIFASFGGPQVSFLLPAEADRFMALGSIDVPARVSRHLACIEPLKEIPIERVFELVVAGARDFDDLGGPLERWARKVAPASFASIRSTELNSDLVIFSMTTWAATLLILKSKESFRKRFPENVSLPRLLWDFNNNPLRKVTLGDQVSKGAEQMSGVIKALQNEVRDMRGELKSVQDQQAVMLGHQSKMVDFMNDIDGRMKNTQQAVSIQGMEIAIRAQLQEMESRVGSLQVAALLSPDALQRAELERAITEITANIELKKVELRDNTNKLSSVSGSGTAPTRSLSQPSTPSGRPPPQITSPAASTSRADPNLQLTPTPRPRKRKTLNSSGIQPPVVQPPSAQPPVVQPLAAQPPDLFPADVTEDQDCEMYLT